MLLMTVTTLDGCRWSLPDENKNANSQVLIKRQQPSAPAVLRCTIAKLQHSYTKLHSRSFSYEYSSTRTAEPECRVAWLTAADGVHGADATWLTPPPILLSSSTTAARQRLDRSRPTPPRRLLRRHGPVVHAVPSSAGACLAAGCSWRTGSCVLRYTTKYEWYHASTRVLEYVHSTVNCLN